MTYSSTTGTSGGTFANELKRLGIVIPEDATSVTVSADKPQDFVRILFEHQHLSNCVVRKSGGVLKDVNGVPIDSTAFFDKIKLLAQLPDGTLSFKIEANPNKVTTITTVSALPLGALEPAEELVNLQNTVDTEKLLEALKAMGLID